MNETPLDAGREMDAYIVQKVMGYEFIELRYFAYDASPRQMELESWFSQFAFDLSVGGYYIDVERDICIPVEDFQPSVNMQHAYSALLKLQERGAAIDIQCFSDSVWWTVRLFRNSKYYAFGAASTLPLAICRAIGNYYQGERDDRSAK